MLQLLCTAITHHHHHHYSAHSPAGIEDTASARHHEDGQDSSASLLPPPPSSSVALQLPMALFLPPARQRSVMPRDTTAHVRGGQAVPAHKHSCVCEHATQLPRLHLASSMQQQQQRPADLAALWEEAHPQCSSSSTCVWRRVAGPLPSMAGTKQRGPGPSHASTDAPFPSSIKCVWHIGCTAHVTLLLCSAPLSVLHHSLLRSMCHHHCHHYHEQQQQMRLSTLLAFLLLLPSALVLH